MNLKIKKLMSIIAISMLCNGAYSPARALRYELSDHSCYYNIGMYVCQRARGSGRIAFARSRAAVLAGGISCIKKKYPNFTGIGREMEEPERIVMKACFLNEMPTCSYEIDICFLHAKSGRDVVEGLKNMKYAYLRLAEEYERAIIGDNLSASTDLSFISGSYEL